MNPRSHDDIKNTDGAEREHNEKDKDEVIQKEKTLNVTSHVERKNTDGDESERDEKDKKEVEITDQNTVEVCGITNLQTKNDDDKRISDESYHDENNGSESMDNN